MPWLTRLAWLALAGLALTWLTLPTLTRLLTGLRLLLTGLLGLLTGLLRGLVRPPGLFLPIELNRLPTLLVAPATLLFVRRTPLTVRLLRRELAFLIGHVGGSFRTNCHTGGWETIEQASYQ
jgi:hypothetical protein